MTTLSFASCIFVRSIRCLELFFGSDSSIQPLIIMTVLLADFSKYLQACLKSLCWKRSNDLVVSIVGYFLIRLRGSIVYIYAWRLGVFLDVFKRHRQRRTTLSSGIGMSGSSETTTVSSYFEGVSAGLVVISLGEVFFKFSDSALKVFF